MNQAKSRLMKPGQELINETRPARLCWETGASGAHRVAGGVCSSGTWKVAWDAVDELLGMTLGTKAVALQGSSGLGPQIQITDIKRNIARVIAWDVPGNIVETQLVSVSLALVSLASVWSALVLLASVWPSCISIGLVGVGLVGNSCNCKSQETPRLMTRCRINCKTQETSGSTTSRLITNWRLLD